MQFPTTFFGWVGFLIDQYGGMFLRGTGVTLLIAAAHLMNLRLSHRSTLCSVSP